MKKLFTIFTALLFIASASAMAKTQEFVTEITNHKFEPAVIKVPANSKFKLIVKNNDKTIEEFESHDLGKEKIISGKKKATIVIGPLEKGEYEFVGEFHEDTAKGKIIAE